MYKTVLAYIALIFVVAISASAQSDPLQQQILQAMTGKTPVPEKKPGVIRIGISMPATEMGKDFTMADTPMAVMNTLQIALTEDKIETVVLDSALPEKEAKLKQCDYVFVSKVTRKKGGGGFGGMMGLGMLAAGAGMIPGAGGIVGSVAASAASTAISAATLSGGFKSKDEVTFEYRISGVDGSVLIPSTSTKQKAKKDGEDVLTPQIATAAKATVEKITLPKAQ
jgi:hypothetical protein